MVKHVILWNIDDKYTADDKTEIKKNIKASLEGLAGKIPGLIDIKVNIDGLSTSTVDLMLDSTFEDEEALETYSKHPLHVAAADNFVRPFTSRRSCLDYTL